MVCGLADPTSDEPTCQSGLVWSPILKETASTSRTEMGLALLPAIPSGSPHRSSEVGTKVLEPSGVITSTIGRGTPKAGSDIINSRIRKEREPWRERV